MWHCNQSFTKFALKRFLTWLQLSNLWDLVKTLQGWCCTDKPRFKKLLWELLQYQTSWQWYCHTDAHTRSLMLKITMNFWGKAMRKKGKGERQRRCCCWPQCGLKQTAGRDTHGWRRNTFVQRRQGMLTLGISSFHFLAVYLWFFFLYACVNNHVLLFFVATGNTFIYHAFMACCSDF